MVMVIVVMVDNTCPENASSFPEENVMIYIIIISKNHFYSSVRDKCFIIVLKHLLNRNQTSMIYQEAEYLLISIFILFGLNFYIQIWILSASWEQGVRPESTGGCCSAENSAPPSIAMQQVN